MARSKYNLKQKGHVNELSLNVTNLSVVLVLELSLHILYLLNEKKETYRRRKTLFSLMRIKVKRNYLQRRS